MKNKKLTVSIGIPAYNEEANIKNLLASIYAQEKGNYVLTRIVIVLDGCTDQTEEKILEVGRKNIIVIKNKKRIGQALSQNKILDCCSDDILILLNSDILLQRSFIKNIIKPFLYDRTIGLVSANARSLSGESFLEKMIHISTVYKTSLFYEWNNGDTHFLCFGRARAFSKQLVKRMRWPRVVNEDVYSYLRSKQLGFKFLNVRESIFYYRLPSKIGEHINQSVRYRVGEVELKKYFSDAFVRKNYRIPNRFLYKYTLNFAISHPILFIGYLVISLYATAISLLKRRQSVLWEPSFTSKKLRYV